MILLVALGTSLLPALLEQIERLETDSRRQRLASFLDSIGPAAIPVLLFLQALQIVIAVLPGGIVEVVSGMLYGAFWGSVISVAGIFAGTIIAFFLANKLGRPFIRRIVSPAAFERYYRLCNDRRFEAFVLFLFFLPGIPKDILIYAIGIGSRSLSLGMKASLIRIPSIFVSVYAGSLFGQGNFAGSAALYLSFFAVGAIGFALNQLLLRRLKP